MPDIQPGYKEELTDMFTPAGIAAIKVGKVLRFNYEGSITNIKVTRKTKDRIWGVHVEMIEYNQAMSHYGHNLDTTVTPVWCTDCDVAANELSTKEGRAKAAKRTPDAPKDKQ